MVSCLALSAAAGLTWTGASKILYVTGISLIVISDTAISLNEFLGIKAADRIVLPTYFPAHLAITASLLIQG
jgi:hypothetical protein